MRSSVIDKANKRSSFLTGLVVECATYLRNVLAEANDLADTPQRLERNKTDLQLTNKANIQFNGVSTSNRDNRIIKHTQAKRVVAIAQDPGVGMRQHNIFCYHQSSHYERATRR